MPIWIISIVARAGVPQVFRKAVAWLVVAVLLVVAVCALIATWNSWRVHDNTRFADSRDKDVTIEAANRVINATYEADAKQDARDQMFANSQEGLRNEVRTKGSPAAVGPATTGVLERLRREQDAARRGDPAR